VINCCDRSLRKRHCVIFSCICWTWKCRFCWTFVKQPTSFDFISWRLLMKSNQTRSPRWLGSRVVSMLDSSAEGPGFKSQLRRCRVSLRQTVHTHRASVHQAAKLLAALLRVAGVTAGLVESNGSLPPGLWLMSPAGWLPRTGITSKTLCSAIEYLLPLPLLADASWKRTQTELSFFSTENHLHVNICSVDDP